MSTGHEGSLTYLDFNFHQPVDLKAGGWRESVFTQVITCCQLHQLVQIHAGLCPFMVMKHILVTQQMINYDIVYDQ